MIKLFEEFNVESLYWVITEEEFDSETDFYGNWRVKSILLPFSEKEILKIREFNLKIGNPDIEVKRKMHMAPYIKMEYIDIYKSDDNYYYVIQNRFGQDRLYYKCDEMEGLFNCIKHTYNY
jgi:hypothetical protein